MIDTGLPGMDSDVPRCYRCGRRTTYGRCYKCDPVDAAPMECESSRPCTCWLQITNRPCPACNA